MSQWQRAFTAVASPIVVALMLPLSAHAQADAVRKLVSEDYDRADAASDVAAKMQLYAGDAVLMPPGEAAVIGQRAIRAWNEAHYAREAFKGTSTVAEVQIFGEWGFARGEWSGVVTPKAGGEPSEISGNFLVIVRRQADGTWKIGREMWTTSRRTE